MRNQSKYFLLYLCVLFMLAGGAIRLAQAQDTSGLDQDKEKQQHSEVLNQAELDQMLAPIALYPDTLLSHILVASSYPLEVVQAARWREKNKTLKEQEALEAVEDKDWDPSVKALVPFNELLQKFSEDLEWLQALGEMFLLNEEQVLSSVQDLRQKAYVQGNLQDNEYLDVEQDQGQIIIQTVEKAVVYVPYYDTRVVYGNWQWGAYPPHYWHRPSHYVWRSGFYWSAGFSIRPSFYFGGFHWLDRHVVADYHYRNRSHRSWREHNSRQTVRVREYPRWSHNNNHRRGVRYQHSQNTKRYVSSNKTHHPKRQHQIDKQRVLNVQHLKKPHTSQQVKQRLAATKHAHKGRTFDKKQSAKALHAARRQGIAGDSSAKREIRNGNNKQRLINAANGQQRNKVVKQVQGERNMRQQSSPLEASKAQREVQKQGSQSNQQHFYRSPDSNNHNSKSKAHSNQRKVKNQRRSSSAQNKSRPVKASKHRKSQSWG